jgi:hypothetical protein
LRYTGADIAMVAGARSEPLDIRPGNASIAGGKNTALASLRERVDVAVRQFETRPGKRAKRSPAWRPEGTLPVIEGCCTFGYFKQRISCAEQLSDLYDIAAGIKRELK